MDVNEWQPPTRRHSACATLLGDNGRAARWFCSGESHQGGFAFCVGSRIFGCPRYKESSDPKPPRIRRDFGILLLFCGFPSRLSRFLCSHRFPIALVSFDILLQCINSSIDITTVDGVVTASTPFAIHDEQDYSVMDLRPSPAPRLYGVDDNVLSQWRRRRRQSKDTNTYR